MVGVKFHECKSSDRVWRGHGDHALGRPQEWLHVIEKSTDTCLLIVAYVPDTVVGPQDGVWSNVDKISTLFKLKI